jgi:hypothetical protein
MAKSNLPEEKWGVHRTHCCSEHGCKYGNDDCPVVSGDVKQDYPCETCSDEMDYGKSIRATHIKDNVWYVGETTTGKHITYIDGKFIIRTTKEMKNLYNWEKNSSQQ